VTYQKGGIMFGKCEFCSEENEGMLKGLEHDNYIVSVCKNCAETDPEAIQGIKAYEYARKIVYSINKVFGGDLTPEDYIEWLQPDNDCGYAYRFNNAVLEFLTSEVYIKLQRMGRLQDGIAYKLGLGPRIVGGVNLKRFMKLNP